MEYLAISIGLIGVFLSGFMLYITYPKKGSWRDVSRAVKYIIKRIRTEAYQPDIVVCFGRGGAIFGGLLAGNLGIVRLVAIDRKKLYLIGIMKLNSFTIQHYYIFKI